MISIVIVSAKWSFLARAIILQVGYLKQSADLAAKGIFSLNAEIEHCYRLIQHIFADDVALVVIIPKTGKLTVAVLCYLIFTL